jgi:hypothetical protein
MPVSPASKKPFSHGAFTGFSSVHAEKMSNIAGNTRR